MIKLIKGGKVYSPNYLGKKDILITGGKIAKIADDIALPTEDFYPVKTINAEKMLIIPGFIDSHVHIIGGGGEGGFKTRTPEIQLTQLTNAGITSVIGVLGTDATTRHLTSLLAKARALEEEGITSYVLTGSYQIPLHTISGICRDDIILIEKIIGVGEIALADHRSSQPTLEEFKRVAALARTGGLLSNKAGIIVVHMGDGEMGLSYLLKIAAETEIPISQFLPTHINRNYSLLKSAVTYFKKGGRVDLTTSSNPNNGDERDSISASKAAAHLLQAGVNPDRITFSSDGMGSLPLFDENGYFKGLGIGSVSSLFTEVKKSVQEENIPLADALKFITSNVAEHFKLTGKGKIAEKHDADLLLLDNELKIKSVFAKGNILIDQGKIMVKGTFE